MGEVLTHPMPMGEHLVDRRAHGGDALLVTQRGADQPMDGEHLGHDIGTCSRHLFGAPTADLLAPIGVQRPFEELSMVIEELQVEQPLGATHTHRWCALHGLDGGLGHDLELGVGFACAEGIDASAPVVGERGDTGARRTGDAVRDESLMVVGAWAGSQLVLRLPHEAVVGE